jgi:hypothetical protein
MGLGGIGVTDHVLVKVVAILNLCISVWVATFIGETLWSSLIMAGRGHGGGDDHVVGVV